MAARKTRGVSAPPPGTYAGTVAGRPAIFGVKADTVYALWLETRRGEYVHKDNCWDVEGGRFAPTNGLGEPLSCTIRRSSRVDPD